MNEADIISFLGNKEINTLDLQGQVITISKPLFCNLPFKSIMNGTLKINKSNIGILLSVLPKNIDANLRSFKLKDVIFDMDGFSISRILEINKVSNALIENCSFINHSRIIGTVFSVNIIQGSTVIIKRTSFSNISAKKVVTGVRVQDSSVKIDTCSFENIHSTGLSNNADAIAIDNIIEYNNNSIGFGFKINNCSFKNISKRFIKVLRSNKGIISNCFAENSLYEMSNYIALQYCRNIQVFNCDFVSKNKGIAYEGIRIGIGSTGTSCKNIDIEKVSISNLSKKSTQQAIRGTGVENITISRSLFSGFKNVLMLTEASKYVYFNNNIAENISEHGFIFNKDITDIKIKENNLYYNFKKYLMVVLPGNTKNLLIENNNTEAA